MVFIHEERIGKENIKTKKCFPSRAVALNFL